MERNKPDTGWQEAGPRGVGSSGNLARGGGTSILKVNVDVVLVIFSITREV